MGKGEQKTFVRELTDAIVREICGHIDADKIPKEWDGHELRVLLADAFDRSAGMSLIRREPRRGRSREYHNTVRIRNLD